MSDGRADLRAATATRRGTPVVCQRRTSLSSKAFGYARPRNGCPSTWAEYAKQMPARVLRERLIDLEVPGEDVARGRALRKTAPRRALAQLTPSPPTDTEILVSQNATRIAELVP